MTGTLCPTDSLPKRNRLAWEPSAKHSVDSTRQIIRTAPREFLPCSKKKKMLWFSRTALWGFERGPKSNQPESVSTSSHLVPWKNICVALAQTMTCGRVSIHYQLCSCCLQATALDSQTTLLSFYAFVFASQDGLGAEGQVPGGAVRRLRRVAHVLCDPGAVRQGVVHVPEVGRGRHVPLLSTCSQFCWKEYCPRFCGVCWEDSHYFIFVNCLNQESFHLRSISLPFGTPTTVQYFAASGEERPMSGRTQRRPLEVAWSHRGGAVGNHFCEYR